MRIDHAGEGDDFAVEFERVRHRQTIGMAGDGDDVRRFEDRRLFQNLLADFTEGEAVAGGIKFLQSTGGLDRLKCNAAHAPLLQCEVDDLAYFIVIQPFFKRDDEGGGDVVFVEPIERATADIR